MAVSEQAELTSEAEERIISVIRSLTEDRVDRGVDLNRPMHCSSCDLEKSPMGATQYGAYDLCNECLLEFTLALAKGEVENVAEYMTRRPEGPDGEPPVETAANISARASKGSLPKRGEKLMPSNEPC